MDQNSAKFLSFHTPKILKTFAVIYGPWKHYKESPRRLALFSFVCLHIVILFFFSSVAVVCLLCVFFFGWLLFLFYWQQLSDKMTTWNTTNFGLGESGEPGGGGDTHMKQTGMLVVSLRVFRAKRQYFKLPRSRLGFCEETQNYVKRNRSQIFFLTCFVYLITSVIINRRFLQIVENIIIRLMSDNKGSVITRCLCALCFSLQHV